MGTGITIVPYIDPRYTSTFKDKNDLATTVSSDASSDQQTEKTFEEALNAAKKAVAAVAIDKLVADSADGSVDAVAVQAFFDQNNININLAKLSSEASGHTTASTSGNPADTAAASDSATSTDGATQATNAGSYTNSGLLECSEELQRYFEEAASAYNVDIKLLKSVAYAESGFNPNSTSGSGAMGIMQLMPATAKEYNVDDPYDARQSIMGGAELLSNLLAKYNGDKSLALAAYNAGPGAVAKYGGIPPYEETQNYVKKVLNFYNS